MSRHPSRSVAALGAALVVTLLGGIPAVATDPSGGDPAATLAAVAPVGVTGPAPVSRSMADAEGPVTAFVALSTRAGVDVAEAGGSPAAVRAARVVTETTAEAVVPAELTPDTVGAPGPQRIATVTNLMAGALVVGDAAQVRALAADAKVTGIYRVVPKTITNATSVTLTQTLAAWQSTGRTGEGVTIGIVDTGIDYTHAGFGGPGTAQAYADAYGADGTGPVPEGSYDLAKFIEGVGYDFAGPGYFGPGSVPVPDANPIDPRGEGHGSHVAATAAGYGVTADGTTFDGDYRGLTDLSGWQVGPGSAPQARLAALKVFGDAGGSTELVIPALDWAADPDGDGDLSDRLDVVNLSLGSPHAPADDPDVLAVERITALGTVVVTSAGNEGDVEGVGGSPGNAASAIAVAASLGADLGGGWATDVLAPFSSRGVHGSLGWAKPDVAAPGAPVVSVAVGSGTGSTARMGTSMASPHVAGIAALVRQAQPGWSVTQVKAAVVNTAVHDVTEPGPQGGVYGPARVGSGRVDALRATTTTLLAYDTERPTATSVSFGVVNVGASTVTAQRRVTIENTGSAPATVDARYVASTTTGGASITVSPARVTVPAGQSTTVTVMLTADPATLARDLDPTQEAETLGLPREHVSRLSGRLVLTSGDGTELRVPVQAVPRPTSALTSPAGLTFVDGTARLQVDGRTLDPDNEWYSFATPMILGTVSPALNPLAPEHSVLTSPSTLAAGDVRHVGWGTTAPALAAAGDDPTSGVLTVGVSTQGEWANLGTAFTLWVDIDVDGDGTDDYSTVVAKALGEDDNPVDLTVAWTIDTTTWETVGAYPVNELFGDVVAGVFDGSVVVVPIPLALIPPGSSPTVTVSTWSYYATDGGMIDQADPFQVDPYDPPVWFESNVGPRQTSLVTDSDRTITAHQGPGADEVRVLMLYPQNSAPDDRVQVLDVTVPGATPTPEPSPTSTTGPGAADGAGAGAGTGVLAVTGADVVWLVVLLVVALSVGAALVAARRRAHG
ncbi:MAG: S8 family serine peptidase [Micrococcales bacterium]|nr:S8 family serine peptidase [Micrococcales bacterium]